MKSQALHQVQIKEHQVYSEAELLSQKQECFSCKEIDPHGKLLFKVTQMSLM